jgi:hypothetical protein
MRAPRPPGLRASDAERDQAISELRHRFAEGRLSHDTFLVRMDAALRAKEHSELSDLFADLPATDERRHGPVRAFAAWLARIWHAAGDRLGRARRGEDWVDGPFAQVPQPQVLAMPSGYGGAGNVGPGYLVAIGPEPQSMCLPRQADRKFTIGRAPSCDFTVADLTVSRWHARLHKEESGWLLCDLGSTNGTRLNGWRVTSAVPVRPGDKVSFGSAAYVITDRPLAADLPEAPVQPT